MPLARVFCAMESGSLRLRIGRLSRFECMDFTRIEEGEIGIYWYLFSNHYTRKCIDKSHRIQPWKACGCLRLPTVVVGVSKQSRFPVFKTQNHATPPLPRAHSCGDHDHVSSLFFWSTEPWPPEPLPHLCGAFLSQI